MPTVTQREAARRDLVEHLSIWPKTPGWTSPNAS